jgi:hypothetical protein
LSTFALNINPGFACSIARLGLPCRLVGTLVGAEFGPLAVLLVCLKRWGRDSLVVNGGRGILATSMANRRSGYAEMRNLLLSRRSQELLVVVGCRWPFVSAAVMRVARPSLEFVYGVMGGRDRGLRDYKSRADSSGRKVIWGPLPVGLTCAHARELNDGADSRAPPARMLRLACAGCLCGAMGMQLCSDRRSQPA